MKIGNLVKLSPQRLSIYNAKASSFLGIIVSFDEDNDPIVQWFFGGETICRESEYRKDIKVI